MLVAVSDEVRGPGMRSSVLKIRLTADLVSVSGARRFVADGLTS
jgi:hypothetical protein